MNHAPKDKIETPKHEDGEKLLPISNAPEFPCTEPSREEDLKDREPAQPKQSSEQERTQARGGKPEVATPKPEPTKPSDRGPMESKKNSSSYMNMMNTVLPTSGSNDARSRAPPLSNQPQFGTLLPVNQRPGALADKKQSINKRLPLQGLHSVNKMSSQISQRSLRLEAESRLKKNGAGGVAANIER